MAYPIPLYHFTHVRNLESIVRSGSLRADAGVGRALVVEVADADIKHRRRTCRVDAGPGGVVGDYVPFYFAPRSPMLYRISCGGVTGYAEGQDPLVYVLSSVNAIVQRRLAFAFSDGNCSAAFTRFFDDLDDLDQVDWALMNERYWANTAEDGDRRRRRGAEFLVHVAVPWEAVPRVGARTTATARQARSILDRFGRSTPVEVRREWYF